MPTISTVKFSTKHNTSMPALAKAAAYAAYLFKKSVSVVEPENPAVHSEKVSTQQHRQIIKTSRNIHCPKISVPAFCNMTSNLSFVRSGPRAFPTSQANT